MEVAPGEEVVGVRDTKDRAGGQLAVSGKAWGAFVSRVAATDGFGKLTQSA